MSELMNQGINLALVGMGVVFTFLALLVLLTTLMSAVLARLPAPDAAMEVSSNSATETGAGQDRQRLVAVISAAIHQHRRRH